MCFSNALVAVETVIATIIPVNIIPMNAMSIDIILNFYLRVEYRRNQLLMRL